KKSTARVHVRVCMLVCVYTCLHSVQLHCVHDNLSCDLHRHGQLKCVELLLQRGAKVVADRDGVTPLELCAQQGYSECIEVIIRFHPGQVENLLQLVCSEKIAENKVLPMMDYLCNSSRQMMTIVLSGLSQKVTTAGMELLRWKSPTPNPYTPHNVRCIMTGKTLDACTSVDPQVPPPPLSATPCHIPYVSGLSAQD
ncbi:hypothetical protein EMCRGX_G020928, partial [Ephydatia muelleri]